MLELSGHRGPIVSLAYSPDGETLASASFDGTVRLWDARTGRLRETLRSPEARAYCVAFSPDGKLLAAGFGGEHGVVQIWDTCSLRRRDLWAPHSRETRAVAFGQGGEKLFTAGNDAAARIWQTDKLVETSPPLGVGHHASSFAVSPNRTALAASVHGPPTLLYLRLPRRRRRFDLQDSRSAYSLCFSTDGARLICGLENAIALVNPEAHRKLLNRWYAHDGAVLGMAFAPDGQSLLSAGADGLVKHWTIDGRLLRTIDWRIGELGAVAIAPDGLTAAVGGAETIVVWDLER